MTVSITNPSPALRESDYLPQSQSPTNQFGSLLNTLGSGYFGGTGGGFGFGGSGFGGTGNLLNTEPTVNLKVQTATWVWADYTLLGTLTANFIRLYGNPVSSEFYGQPLKSQMIRYLITSWRPLYREGYNTGFYYYPLNCIEPDGSPIQYDKNYTY